MAWEEWLQEAVLADLPADRRWSYLFFTIALSVALMTFQFISPVKIAIFANVVGMSAEPIAKTLVLVVLFPILVIYSVLVSLLSTRGLVFAICGFYTVVFFAITMLMILHNGNPPHWVAWALYFATETRGVIVMPMVWSVVADVSTADLSKKAYSFIFCGIQCGGIIGSFFAINVSSLGGEVGLLLLTTGSFAVIGGFTVLALSMIADNITADERMPITSVEAPARNPGAAATTQPVTDESVETPQSKSTATVVKEALCSGLDGLWLLLSRPYAMMVFWVSYAYLVPRTVLDYEQIVLAQHMYSSREAQVVYFGRLSMCTNILTALMTLFGTRKLIHIFGVGRMLLLLPMVIFLCIVAVSVHYDLAMASVSVIVASTVAYGLNSPCKEILYVRTSRDIKYKAKAWSEMYGNQMMKMLGAQINLWINNDHTSCQPNCFSPASTISVIGVWVAAWFMVAINVGSKYTELDANDKIVT